MGRVIKIPYRPRSLQREIHGTLRRFNVLVCHRRFGKTVLCINELIKKAVTCQREAPRYAYIAPLYRQAKQVAWDYLKHYTAPIPGRKANESELRVDLPGDIRIQLFGADNPDALRGIYMDGVVLDEYAQMSPRLWGEIIRPALADREGWAIFIGTPMGHNAFWEIYEQAQSTEGWYAALYKASATGVLDEKEAADLKATLSEEEYAQEDEKEAADLKATLSEEEYAQELECSFTAAVRGSYYGKLLSQADEDRRIANVPHDTSALVETWWDLGFSDSTAIWFAQRVGQEIHLIDFYETSGEGLAHYVNLLQPPGKAWRTTSTSCNASGTSGASTMATTSCRMMRRPPSLAQARAVSKPCEAWAFPRVFCRDTSPKTASRPSATCCPDAGSMLIAVVTGSRRCGSTGGTGTIKRNASEIAPFTTLPRMPQTPSAMAPCTGRARAGNPLNTRLTGGSFTDGHLKFHSLAAFVSHYRSVLRWKKRSTNQIGKRCVYIMCAQPFTNNRDRLSLKASHCKFETDGLWDRL
jgi:hypothetical protein